MFLNTNWTLKNENKISPIQPVALNLGKIYIIRENLVAVNDQV